MNTTSTLRYNGGLEKENNGNAAKAVEVLVIGQTYPIVEVMDELMEQILFGGPVYCLKFREESPSQWAVPTEHIEKGYFEFV